jgi:hypothetical protein
MLKSDFWKPNSYVYKEKTYLVTSQKLNNKLIFCHFKRKEQSQKCVVGCYYKMCWIFINVALTIFFRGSKRSWDRVWTTHTGTPSSCESPRAATTSSSASLTVSRRRPRRSVKTCWATSSAISTSAQTIHNFGSEPESLPAFGKDPEFGSPKPRRLSTASQWHGEDVSCRKLAQVGQHLYFFRLCSIQLPNYC